MGIGPGLRVCPRLRDVDQAPDVPFLGSERGGARLAEVLLALPFASPFALPFALHFASPYTLGPSSCATLRSGQGL
ncbi:MAG: hypothetical protein KGM47_15460 [Acidobacteriota bacterium]|nr:hypothetical protein [Acidobacteriota bacterium]